MSGFEGQKQLPLFPYDCTAQAAQAAQAESAAVIQDVIKKQELSGRLKNLSLNKAIALANQQYNYQGESTLAALACSNAINVLPKSFSEALLPRMKDAFIQNGVSGLGKMINITSPEVKEAFFRDLQLYNLVGKNFHTIKTVEGQKPLFVFSWATATYHRISVGDAFQKVQVHSDNIEVWQNPDEFSHMIFGELYQNGEPLEGFGDYLRKSTFGQNMMSILRCELKADFAPRAYSLKTTKSKDGELVQEISNDAFALYKGTTWKMYKTGFVDGVIKMFLNRNFFPVKRAGQSNTGVLIDGGYSLFLSGLYPLLHCCAKWCRANKRKVGVDPDNQYMFFLAMQFSDKNAAQLGITNEDFENVFRNRFYKKVNTQHFVRLGEAPLAELLGCKCFEIHKDGKKHVHWGELAAKITMIARNFYAFLKGVKLLDIYTNRLKYVKTQLYLPVDALAVPGSVKIRTAGFFEWCELMEEAERKANERYTTGG